MVRLVKGAYWDAEIKLAQERGLERLPGVHAQGVDRRLVPRLRARLFADPLAFYPAFATHNAHTLAAVAELAIARRQRRVGVPAPARHGRGTLRPDRRQGQWGRACRVYAPVGSHEDLLAYLVRRCWRTAPTRPSSTASPTPTCRSSTLLADPVEKAAALATKRHPGIPAARELFGAERANSEGLDMNDKPTLDAVRRAIEQQQIRELRRRAGDRRPGDDRGKRGRCRRRPTNATSSGWSSRRHPTTRPGDGKGSAGGLPRPGNRHRRRTRGDSRCARPT
jgi:RHH-type proline utilization regulon transcriptional repressor/proline dehydrogenase/delta 1-pyrroline-5-carboxylate dehydrogenase